MCWSFREDERRVLGTRAQVTLWAILYLFALSILLVYASGKLRKWLHGRGTVTCCRPFGLESAP
jgi:hypothetical protein